MKTRGEELRRRHRRIVVWSLVVAAVLHAAVILFWTPSFRTDPWTDPGAEVEATRDPMEAPVPVLLVFGPPTISLDDGTTWTEPPERVLHASRVVEMPAGCEPFAGEGRSPLRGRARLRVGASGDATAVGLVEGTGLPCADGVLVEVVGALRYRWLPSERFPAPVDLIQPVSMGLATSPV